MKHKELYVLLESDQDAEAKPSLDWFINLIKPIVDQYVITGYAEVETCLTC